MIETVEGKPNIINISRKLSTGMVLFTIILTIFFSACSSTDSNSLSGEVIGIVQPLDQWGRQMEAQKGFKVQLENTPITATTTASGHFKLTDVKPGTYTINYTKERYGTMKIPFYQFAGEGKDFVLDGQEMTLGIIPEYGITIDSTYINSQKKIVAAGIINVNIPKNGRSTIVMYVGKKPEISPDDPSTYIDVSSIVIRAGNVYSAFYNLAAFNPGDTLYFRSYPIADASLFYPDPSGKTFKSVYCCLGTASKTSMFIVPESVNPKTSSISVKNRLAVTVLGKNEKRKNYFNLPESPTPIEMAKLRQRISRFISNK